MTQSITLGGQTFTYDGLYSLSGPDLVKVHNLAAPKAGVEPTKRFSDKVSAVKRTWAVLTKVSDGGGEEPEAQRLRKDTEALKALAEDVKAVKAKAAPAPKAKKAAPAPKEKKAGKPRGKRFVFPQAEELKTKVRSGTNRATLIELMSRREGATFEECLAATWGKNKDMAPEIQAKTCYEAIRLVHYYTGYGMRQTETGERKGAIHLFFNEK